MPDDELPVLLPDDVDFQPGGESPLARHPSWSKVACPTCGGDARRDTDTMDTFVDSSWYFFRYCSPGFEEGPFRREDVDRWMPADQYTGGVEHAILHLLYCRFFTKALYDFGLIGFSEPFPRLMNQGQVIYGGASMSKTKGNIVEPMPIIDRWGADSLRLIMLFAGPVRGRHRLDADRGRREQAPGGPRLAGARVRGDGRGGGSRGRRGATRCVGTPHAPDDQGRDRGPGAVPVQHRDLQAAGADERDALGAGRRRGSAGRGHGPGADAGPVRAVRRRGAVAGGAGERVVGPRVVVADVRPVPRRGGHA